MSRKNKTEITQEVRGVSLYEDEHPFIMATFKIVVEALVGFAASVTAGAIVAYMDKCVKDKEDEEEDEEVEEVEIDEDKVTVEPIGDISLEHLTECYNKVIEATTVVTAEYGPTWDKNEEAVNKFNKLAGIGS